MKTCLWVLLGSIVYATARYNIFKGVPWNDWPAYTLNKAFAATHRIDPPVIPRLLSAGG